MSYSPYFALRSFRAFDSGSTDVSAMGRPSGDHAKEFTPFSNLVSCRASPPAGGINQICRLPSGEPESAPGRSERNAIHLLSGDQVVSVLDFLLCVSA